MSVVRINAITVPKERAKDLIERFANRAGEVSKMPGFEAFELLAPTDDRDVFLVYTRWRTQDDFDAWLKSQAFQHGHKAHGEQGPVGTGSELWSFDVVQEEREWQSRPDGRRSPERPDQEEREWQSRPDGRRSPERPDQEERAQ
jgi:heme-degrading monooxygenase HmoA